jgi:enoyl-CoA hydratase/carnithine racemase
MSVLVTEYVDNIAILRMVSGVTNPISLDLVNEMSESLVDIKTKARGMILCGGGKFFCIGLDLPNLLKLDRSAMSVFLRNFTDLTVDLFTLSIPSICALSGHAIAGGCVFALTGDYRIASTENKKIGLNEIKLGVPVPYIADMMLRHTVGDRIALQMLYSGEFIPFNQARDIGLIDEICPTEKIENLAMEKISKIASHPNQAFSAMKASKVEQIKARYEKNWEATNQVFLNCWFSEPGQTLLRDASKKF